MTVFSCGYVHSFGFGRRWRLFRPVGNGIASHVFERRRDSLASVCLVDRRVRVSEVRRGQVDSVNRQHLRLRLDFERYRNMALVAVDRRFKRRCLRPGQGGDFGGIRSRLFDRAFEGIGCVVCFFGLT
jgi:hypothetical protein